MPVWKQILVCLVLAVAAGGGWYFLRDSAFLGVAAEGAAEGGGGSGPAEAGGNGRGGGRAARVPGMPGAGGATNVITAAVGTDTEGEAVTALGTAAAAQSVTLFPEVSGIVAEVSFQPGEAVQAGAVLVRLKDDEQAVAAERARVTLEQAQEALERSQALAKSKTITAVALSEAQTAAELAEIELRAAEVALARQRIEAPFAGTVGLTEVSTGDLVTSSTEITTLEDATPLKVGFEVPERFAGRIAAGQAIEASAQGVPGARLAGKITAIDNRIDASTRTLRLEAELANDDAALKPGMAVEVTLRFDAGERLAVPTLSVQWDRRGSYVWKVVDGAAQRAAVTILRRQTGLVLVGGELAAGDRVVVEGIQRLRDGAAVAEVAAPGAEPAPALRGSAGEAEAAEPAVAGRARS